MSSVDEYPDVGDFVVVTVQRIARYGAYVRLDEYPEKEALIHTSELSTTWVKNIRDFAREGQKLVCKVLRVNTRRGQIDLSLRRVTGREKKEKLLQWKLDKKADSILKTANEKMSLPVEQFDQMKSQILEKYNSVYDALEEAVTEGSSILTKLGIDQKHADILAETAALKIKLEEAKVKGVVEMSSSQPHGIDDIKTSLLKAMKVKKPRRADITMYALGAPRYQIKVSAGEFSQAEEILEKSINAAIDSIKELKGEGKKTS